jgi:hypothetical protein
MRFIQALKPADKLKRREFCEAMQLKMEGNDFVERLIFPICADACRVTQSANVEGLKITHEKL